MITCSLYETEREILVRNIKTLYPNFSLADKKNAFLFLLQSQDDTVLSWVGKFVYSAFIHRGHMYKSLHK